MHIQPGFVRDPPAHFTCSGLWCMWGVDLGTRRGMALVLGVLGCVGPDVGAVGVRRSRGVGSPTLVKGVSWLVVRKSMG